MSEVFGRIVSATCVRRNIEDTLRLFMPDYLAEVADQTGFGRDYLPPIASWVMSTDVDNWPEDQLPACIVVCPGLLGEPERDSSEYTAEWAASVAFIVASTDREGSLELTELYCAAARAALLQHPSLPYFDEDQDKIVGGIADGVIWLDESYDEAPIEASRTLGAGRISLGIIVEGVLDVYKGIGSPSQDPTVEPVGITVTETEVAVRKVAHT